MDLRDYFRKIRETDETLRGEYVVVVSKDTGDGGKAGVRSEVTRAMAARLIVEGRARKTTEKESAEFYREEAAKKKSADDLAAATRLRVTVVQQAQEQRG